MNGAASDSWDSVLWVRRESTSILAARREEPPRLSSRVMIVGQAWRMVRWAARALRCESEGTTVNCRLMTTLRCSLPYCVLLLRFAICHDF